MNMLDQDEVSHGTRAWSSGLTGAPMKLQVAAGETGPEAGMQSCEHTYTYIPPICKYTAHM